MKSHRLIPLAVALVSLTATAAEPASAAPATPAAPAAKTAPLYESGKTDGAKTPASYATYELRGFFGAGENLEVSLREKGTTESRWYKVGEKKDGILIEAADPSAGTVTLAVGRNRYKINLAGESAPAEAAKLSPEEEARQARRARFREMMERTSPEQQQAFQKVMGEKMAAMRAAHPDWFKGPPDEATQKQMRPLFLAATREAAEASAKLPDKFGVTNPLPADFDSLMSSLADDREGWRRRDRQAPAPAPAKAAAPATETKPAG